MTLLSRSWGFVIISLGPELGLTRPFGLLKAPLDPSLGQIEIRWAYFSYISHRPEKSSWEGFCLKPVIHVTESGLYLAWLGVPSPGMGLGGNQHLFTEPCPRSRERKSKSPPGILGFRFCVSTCGPSIVLNAIEDTGNPYGSAQPASQLLLLCPCHIYIQRRRTSAQELSRPGTQWALSEWKLWFSPLRTATGMVWCWEQKYASYHLILTTLPGRYCYWHCYRREGKELMFKEVDMTPITLSTAPYLNHPKSSSSELGY